MQGEDSVLNVLRAHAVVGPDHANDRNVDRGKDVDRHPQGGAASQQANEDQNGADRVCMPEHKSDN
jgi:hypothetical protein